MNRAAPRLLTIVLLTLTACLPSVPATMAPPTPLPVRPFPYRLVAPWPAIAIEELSGIVFHPSRGTLFAVTDAGDIAEFGTDGTLIRSARLREEADLEGITCDPATGLLYAAVEGEERILQIAPERLAIVRQIDIDRRYDRRILLDPQGQGIEGIAYVPERGTFFLVNQSDHLNGPDPSIVVEVAVDGASNAVGDAASSIARIVAYFGVGLTDLSGIHYDPASQQLLITSDDNDALVAASLDGQVLAIYALPGEHQEGIALDDAGFLYIAQDLKDDTKGILKYAPFE